MIPSTSKIYSLINNVYDDNVQEVYIINLFFLKIILIMVRRETGCCNLFWKSKNYNILLFITGIFSFLLCTKNLFFAMENYLLLFYFWIIDNNK